MINDCIELITQSSSLVVFLLSSKLLSSPATIIRAKKECSNFRQIFQHSIFGGKGSVMQTPLRTAMARVYHPCSPLVGAQRKERGAGSVLFYQKRWEQRENSFTFFPLRSDGVEAGSGFAEPGLPCHQRFISTTAPSHPLGRRSRERTQKFN